MSPTATAETDVTHETDVIQETEATGATGAIPALAPPPARAKFQGPAQSKAAWQIVQLAVDSIDPSPYQPRLTFDPAEMVELVASVRERGVQQPILVRTAKADSSNNVEPSAKAEPLANGAHGSGKNGNSESHNSQPKPRRSRPEARPRYELIAGERRLRACREAGRKHIPAIVRDDLSDRECAELALLENIQRSNLSVIEEARGYKQLMLQFGMKEERLARKVGKSVPTIQNSIRLLQLPEAVQELLAQKKLSASHGQELLLLASFERVCTSVAQYAVENRVTALALGANPLPNAVDLKRRGLLRELGYETKFDWRTVCATCPHKALLASGYASYCLKPEEWSQKQEAALAQRKDATARAMEQVREQVRQQERDGRIDLSALPAGSYRNLSLVQVPQGCGEGCPCRRQACQVRETVSGSQQHFAAARSKRPRSRKVPPTPKVSRPRRSRSAQVRRSERGTQRGRTEY